MHLSFIRTHNKDPRTISRLNSFWWPPSLTVICQYLFWGATEIKSEKRSEANIDSGVFSKCVQGYTLSVAMASLTSSSRRSSSSYRSSARYSTSSSYRSEGLRGGSSDSLDPLFEPFLDSSDHSSLFGEEGPGGPSSLAPFSTHSRSSYGLTGKKNWQMWAPCVKMKHL